MAGGEHSYEIEITMKADTHGLRDRLDDIKDRANDVSYVLHWAGRHLQRAYSNNFTTLGAESSASMLKGMWPPLDLRYASWKATHFPLAPMMVMTGALLASTKNLTRNPSSDVDRMEAVFAIDSRIAKWHQYGTKHMPARPLVFVPRGFEHEFGSRVAKYVSEGKIPND